MKTKKNNNTLKRTKKVILKNAFGTRSIGILLWLIFSLFFTQKSNAQWIYSAQTTGTGTPTYLETSNTGYTIYFGNGANDMTLVNTELGIGLTPSYKLDVDGDIDVNTTTNGYRIGGNTAGWGYILYNDGIISNLYCGIGAGSSLISGINNTLVGYQTGNSITTGHENGCFSSGAGYNLTTGYSNVWVGYQSGYDATSQYENTGVGYQALQFITTGGNAGRGNTAEGFWSMGGGAVNGKYNVSNGYSTLYDDAAGTCNTADGAFSSYHNTSGNYNVAVGDEALDNNTTFSNNVAIGHAALFNNLADNNTAIGYEAAQNDNTGTLNTANGYEALFGSANYAGSFNTAMGTQAMNNVSSGNSNAAVGYQAMFDNTTGSDNSALGHNALFTNTTGSNNTAVGSGADVSVNGLTDATAIGYNAKVTANDNMILGNNSVNAGIGMSGIAGGPANKLELSWYSAASPNPTGAPGSNINLPGTCSYGSATGESGLQFRDLTSASTPYPNCPEVDGFLTVDANGNVIKMDLPPGKGAGYCSNGLTSLSGSAGYNLNNAANFYFAGNSNGTTVNNVIIGKTCQQSPAAKLDVLQESGSGGSIGVYIENGDTPSSTATIGLESRMHPMPSAASRYKVAGWFDAPWSPTGTNIGYSIFVPLGSTQYSTGIVSIGYNLGFVNSYTDLLQVNSDIYANGNNIASDRRYKQDFSPFVNALQKIDSINPVYFYYDTVNYARFNFSSHQQVGFVAQNVDSVLPQVVQINDSGYYSMDYSRMTALLLAGEKELKLKTDTLNGLKGSVDSLKETVDSLRTAFNSAMSCINNLCNNQGGRMEHGNNTGGNNFSNVQDVTLSTAAILYQNTPNPFGSGGTRINYYLPEGTMGASIVFFDAYGNKLKEVQLSQTGMGSININPNQLSNGVYTYSLVINGNVVDTKKMVFNK